MCFKLKIALVGGYRGMSSYWNEYGIYNTNTGLQYMCSQKSKVSIRDIT